ncbi:MAG: hypothetical protein IJ072_04735 [Oscillospiraceae bacterium]|nr:hypothetical protein [Oscillospiraceae bacterium]
MSINRFTADMKFSPLFRAGELSHAYIISGGDAEGRTALAATIAAATVCQGADMRPCGTCAQCRKSIRDIHPDIIHVDKPKDRAMIPVDEVRRVCADAAVVPNDADAKAYIFDDAALLNPQAQNAMLKTLEEPPGRVAFILCVENPGVLLDTVRSRCVSINLSPPQSGQDGRSAHVQAFFDALGGGDMDMIRFSFSVDKLERQQMLEFAVEARDEAARLLRSEVTGGRCGIPAQRLVRAIEVLEKVTTYLEANVSTVHAAGLLAAALTGSK